MCSFVAGVSSALGIGGSYFGQRAMYQQAQQTLDAQSKAAIMELNYAYQNYEQERTDAFDSAVAEIMKVRTNALQLNSGAKAAVNEYGSGRTGQLLTRSVEGDTSRAIASVKDNYTRKSNEVDLNEEAKFRGTSSYINNINASAPKMPGRLANFLTTGADVLGTYTMAQNQKNSVIAAGQKYNWWTGGAKLGKTSANSDLWVGTAPRTVHKQKGLGVRRYYK